MQTPLPPEIDPGTSIELWTVTFLQFGGELFGSRSLCETSTWGEKAEYVLKAVDVPARVFGLTEPMIVVVLRFNGRSVLLYTRSEFEKIYSDLKIRTQPEESEWMDQVLNKAKLSLLKDQIKILELRTTLTKANIQLAQAQIFIAEVSSKK